jgi:hypothetical protein
MVSTVTSNPSIDPLPYITVLEGRYDVMNLINVLARFKTLIDKG